MARIRVATYNVLSPNLCSAGYFRSCVAADCSPDTRRPRVLKMIDQEIQLGSIICLQEVSTMWYGNIFAHLSKAKYDVISASYGSQFSGYMGVLLAYPRDHYEVVTASTTCIADTKQGYPQRPPSVPSGWLPSTLTWLSRLFAQPPAASPPARAAVVDDEAWRVTKSRKNQMIVVRLKALKSDRLREFCVGTYHMPCVFESPQVMVAHTALSAQNLLRQAGGLPCVFAGDFNVKPRDSAYTLLTTGSLAPDHPDYPTSSLTDDSWTPDLPNPFQSAYVAATGSEPEFTNKSQVKNDPIFVDTLDYIMTQGFDVCGVRPLPSLDDVEHIDSFPTASEPSDHLLLAAELEFK